MMIVHGVLIALSGLAGVALLGAMALRDEPLLGVGGLVSLCVCGIDAAVFGMLAS